MKLVECEEDEGHCLTNTFSNTMIFPSISFTFKGCARTDQCSQDYYSTTSKDERFLQMNVACCESDACNTAPLPQLIRGKHRPNGYVCPGFYQQNEVSYEGYGPILCYGDDTQCFSLNLNLNARSAFRSTVIAQGCTTKGACSYPTGEIEEAHGLLHYNLTVFECQNALKIQG
ncbi:phospholipase A2 inhibitor subunit gamma B-like [Crotalus tigris]|uniref:phospholipase A2 inhibitor subunit gamma B-like n=1 Tax=Crotalus tigris TaxID=88082 RepID=UPI00192F1C7D|nr:phospholipase A2 inhibitor subunit gamma B-like [Crotalus tigris]